MNPSRTFLLLIVLSSSLFFNTLFPSKIFGATHSLEPYVKDCIGSSTFRLKEIDLNENDEKNGTLMLSCWGSEAKDFYDFLARTKNRWRKKELQERRDVETTSSGWSLDCQTSSYIFGSGSARGDNWKQRSHCQKSYCEDPASENRSGTSYRCNIELNLSNN